MKTLVLDIETTGLPPKNSTYKKDFNDYPYIVTIAWKVNEEPTKYFIINQEGREIPIETINIHGITNEMANASPHTICDVLKLLCLEGLFESVIGHNIYFDSSIIKANVLRMIKEGKIDEPFYILLEEFLHKDRRIDTMMSTIKFCNIPSKFGAKWPKLTELYFVLFNETFEAHNAKEDVDATYKCYVKLKELKVI